MKSCPPYCTEWPGNTDAVPYMPARCAAVVSNSLQRPLAPVLHDQRPVEQM